MHCKLLYFQCTGGTYWLKEPCSKSFCNVNIIHLCLQIQSVLHPLILAQVLLEMTLLNIMVVKKHK